MLSKLDTTVQVYLISLFPGLNSLKVDRLGGKAWSRAVDVQCTVEGTCFSVYLVDI